MDFNHKNCWKVKCYKNYDVPHKGAFVKGETYRIKDKFPTVSDKDELSCELVTKSGMLIQIKESVMRQYFVASHDDTE